MKVNIKLFSVVLFCVLLCGCTRTGIIEEQNTSSVITTNSLTSGQQDDKVLSVPQLKNDAMPVYHQQWGKLTSESSSDMVAVVSDNINNSSLETDVYIVAEIDNNFITHNLGKWEYKSFKNGSLSVADLDNDGIDEITLFMEVTGNGGTIAQIFKVINKSITLVYDLNEYDLNLNTEYKNGYVMLIENKSVGFSYEVDISQEFAPNFFNKSGKATSNAEIFVLPINCLAVESTDNVNTKKIYCEYGIKLTNYLGYMQTEFQYDAETDFLEIKSIKFIGN